MRKERERVRERMTEAGSGWQSVEASGADQLPDGGNSGILTLQQPRGLLLLPLLLMLPS